MDSTHTGQFYFMGFSGLRRGLAGPLATLIGQFLFVRNPGVLLHFRKSHQIHLDKKDLSLYLRWFLSFSIHEQQTHWETQYQNIRAVNIQDLFKCWLATRPNLIVPDGVFGFFNTDWTQIWMCWHCVCVSKGEIEVIQSISDKSMLGELTCVGQFWKTWSVVAWPGSFAPALPQSNQIAPEEHLYTNASAIVRVASVQEVTKSLWVD